MGRHGESKIHVSLIPLSVIRSGNRVCAIRNPLKTRPPPPPLNGLSGRAVGRRESQLVSKRACTRVWSTTGSRKRVSPISSRLSRSPAGPTMKKFSLQELRGVWQRGSSPNNRRTPTRLFSVPQSRRESRRGQNWRRIGIRQPCSGGVRRPATRRSVKLASVCPKMDNVLAYEQLRQKSRAKIALLTSPSIFAGHRMCSKCGSPYRSIRFCTTSKSSREEFDATTCGFVS